MTPIQKPSGRRAWQFPTPIVPALVLYCLLVSLYLWVVPPLEGFDPIAHYNYVNWLGEHRTLPPIDHETAAASYEIPPQPPLYYALAAAAAAGTPYAEARQFALRSDNAYLPAGLSQRWSVTLPDVPGGVTRSMWAARLVSALGGLLAVAGTWLLVSELAPGRPSLATAAACIVGLNPLFLFESATINNNSWAAAGAATTLWLVTRAARSETFSPWRWFLAGCIGGIATLAKYSVALVAVPSLVVVLWQAKRIGIRRLALAGLLVLAGCLLTAGFWYVRNVALYGEVVPFRQMSVALPTLLRQSPLGAAEIRAKLPWIVHSYWGAFVAVFAPDAYYAVLRWFVILGCLGLPVYLIRPGDDRSHRRFLVLVCGLWFTAVAASLINWMRLVEFGDQARQLLIASPALALLLVLGWQAFVPESWSRRLHLALTVMFVLVALWPLPRLVHGYAVPKSMGAPAQYDRAIQAKFDGGMAVLGIDLPEGAAVERGAELPVTIYLGAESVIAEDYTLFLHLASDEEGFFGFDGVAFQGRHPTRQWIPGRVFADTYQVAVDPGAEADAGTLANLVLGFYARDSKEPTEAYDAAGRPIGDSLVLARVRILAEPPAIRPAPDPAVARWQNGIHLVSAQSQDAADGSYAFALEWQTAALIHQDYAVFLQALDAGNQVVAQVDRQPGQGQAPTSTWLEGEVIHDEYRLEMPSTGWTRVIVGFYDQVTGERLLLEQPSQGQDFCTLLERPTH